MLKTLLKAWMERSCVALVFGWRCPQASQGRAVGVPAVVSLTPMIGVISVEIVATMLMTAIASAREAAGAGQGYGPVLGPAHGLAHMGADTALAPAAAVTAEAVAVLLPTPGAEAGLAPRHVRNPGLQ